MKLVWFEIEGYKRFAEHSKVNLSEKLVAIVGPNEAGKTSLLRCLQHFNHRKAFVDSGGSQELTRGAAIEDDDTIAEWTFALDDDDRAAIKDIPEATSVRWYAIEKKKTGKAFFSLKPWPKRDISIRQRLREELEGALSKLAEANNSDPDDEGTRDYSGLIEKFSELSAELTSKEGSLPESIIDKIVEYSTIVRKTPLSGFEKKLKELHSHEAMDSPSDRVGTILSKRQPNFLMFSTSDRNLKSEYDLSPFFRVANPQRGIPGPEEIPTALQNLAHAANLDLESLHQAQSNNDRGRVATILEKAQEKITELVQDSWTQSKLTVSFELDGQRFQILIRSMEGEYVKVVERSDGLRQFVALLMFLARQPNTECKPILLIDEAESRLHYDAQADLTQVLAKQQLASKVIYTTHSIGCLPEDLGSGIRMVVAGDPNSVIENYFWNSQRPGFSPLLFAMGAQTLAFLPIRYAMIAEGAADMILVPAMLKAFLGKEHLGFQVVPGLSSGTSSEIAILDNESTRTAYLVDGDRAGRLMYAKIKEAGVAEKMILSLPKIDGEETVIEDYVPIETYMSAVSEELRRSGSESSIVADDLPRPNRPKRLEEWCKKNNVNVPSKRMVAYHVVEKRFDFPLVDDSVHEQIRELHSTIMKTLGLEDLSV
ncbi:MAG: AAA family ATPase [Planctomycetota bacterium]